MIRGLRERSGRRRGALREAAAGGFVGSAPAAGVPARAPRRLGGGGRRAVAAAGGLLLVTGSVAGFVRTADAFDERSAVVVAARDLPRGHVLAVGDLDAALVLPGAVPHLEWSDGAAAALAGLALTHSVPAGSLVTAGMLAGPAAGAFGDRLEVLVPVDTSLVPSGVAEGDLVLLIDPGASPSGSDPGRARRVIDTLVAESLTGNALRLFAPPAEWAQWRTLPARLGGPPMVLPVPPGGDAAVLAAELNAVWAVDHQMAAAAGSPLGAAWETAGGPGLLQTVVPVDASLSASGVAQGDLALLVDPGVPLDAASGGRPRSVLRTVRLDHYRDGLLGIWAEPAEWVWWQSLAQRLGAAPMLLRVTPDADTDAISADLNEAWRKHWEQRQ